MALAQYYTDEPGRKPFKGDYPRFMGTYTATSPQAAFRQFIEAFAPNAKRAQIFYNNVTMVPLLSSDAYEFKMDSVYSGEMFKFPNPRATQEE